MHDLSTWARAAVAHVDARAAGGPLDSSVPVTLNFHPDRQHRGIPILQAMARTGRYGNQFETGTSNGGLTAHPGGARWGWEQRIFGGAYDDAPAQERPKYGALNHRGSATGGAPRFGSAHLRLAANTLARTTFCYPDSFFEPQHFATATQFALADLTDRADADLAACLTDPLDGYVEAHVHGVVDLATDVEALVLDPAFRGTAVEHDARRLGCAVEWHGGFRVDLDTVREHPDYRGPDIVALAETVAADFATDSHPDPGVVDRAVIDPAVIDPAVIGVAVAAGVHDPQDLKRVWHCLARFGAPAEGVASAGSPTPH